MNLVRISKLRGLLCAIAIVLITSSAFAATTNKTRQFVQGEKAKVSGLIVTRDGDLVRIRDKRAGGVIVVSIGDTTHIERKNHKFPFYRHTDMDVTALLPGLTIEAEGIGNSNGQLEASKISFTPDDFAIEVAQEQQVLANKAAAQNAESTANQAATAAGAAQSSADQAQDSAEQATLQAEAAGVVGLADAAAIAAVDQRVSDLDDYKIESENDVFFDRDSAILKEDAKPRIELPTCDRTKPCRLFPKNLDAAGSRLVEADDGPQEHRLSRTRPTDDAEHLAAPDIEIEAMKDQVAAEPSLQPAHTDRRRLGDRAGGRIRLRVRA